MVKLKNAKDPVIRYPYWSLAKGAKIIGTIVDKREILPKKNMRKFNSETGEVYMNKVLVVQIAEATIADVKAKGSKEPAEPTRIEAGKKVAVNLKLRIQNMFELPLGTAIQIICTGKGPVPESGGQAPWEFETAYSEEGLEDDTPTTGGAAAPTEAEATPSKTTAKGSKK